jgi:glucokinase
MSEGATQTGLVLAADIGGTKTVLGLFEPHGPTASAVKSVHEATYGSRDHGTFDEILADFLSRAKRPPVVAACLGVAGAVIEGRVKTTNLPWLLDESDLSRVLYAPAKLLNDLEAAAYGMLFLKDDQVVVLNRGTRPRGKGNIAVIAAGTGLGEAMLYYDGRYHHPVASEGGHGSFAPTTDPQIELLQWLRRRFEGRASNERVLAGPGLRNVYTFLRETSGVPEPEWLTEQMTTGDPSAAITRAGLEKQDSVCTEALTLFASIYGAEAGDMALRCLALGGVFVGGGIAPKMLPVLMGGAFMAAFTNKGRFREFAEQTHVAVSLEPRAPLIGSAHYALRLI